MSGPGCGEWLLAMEALLYGISKQENTSHNRPMSVILFNDVDLRWDAVVLPVATTLDQHGLGSCAFIPMDSRK